MSASVQEFFYDMMNLIDLVSILPFYIELVAAGLQVHLRSLSNHQ